MKKTCFANQECPVARGYDVIGDWWTLLIVGQVLSGHGRFSEIQENLGMAKNILTTRLGKLVKQGILEKVPASDGSAYQQYAPTARGRDLHTIIIALRQWGEKHLFTCDGPKYRLVDAVDGKAIPAIEVRAADGRILGPNDLRIVNIKPARARTKSRKSSLQSSRA